MDSSVYFLVTDLRNDNMIDTCTLCSVEGIHTSVQNAVRHARDNLKLSCFQVVKYPLNSVHVDPSVVYISFAD